MFQHWLIINTKRWSLGVLRCSFLWETIYGSNRIRYVTVLVTHTHAGSINANGAEHARDKKSKEELDEMVMTTARIGGSLIMSDYVPWLSFIPKLQCWPPLLRSLRDSRQNIAMRLFELENYRFRGWWKIWITRTPRAHMCLIVLMLMLMTRIPCDNGKMWSNVDLINIVMHGKLISALRKQRRLRC